MRVRASPAPSRPVRAAKRNDTERTGGRRLSEVVAQQHKIRMIPPSRKSGDPIHPSFVLTNAASEYHRRFRGNVRCGKFRYLCGKPVESMPHVSHGRVSACHG